MAFRDQGFGLRGWGAGFLERVLDLGFRLLGWFRVYIESV